MQATGIIPACQTVEFIVTQDSAPGSKITFNTQQNQFPKIQKWPVTGIEVFYDGVMPLSPTGTPLCSLEQLKKLFWNIQFSPTRLSGQDSGLWINNLPFVNLLNVTNSDNVYTWQRRDFNKIYIDWNNTQIVSPASLIAAGDPPYAIVFNIYYLIVPEGKEHEVVRGSLDDTLAYMAREMSQLREWMQFLFKKLGITK